MKSTKHFSSFTSCFYVSIMMLPRNVVLILCSLIVYKFYAVCGVTKEVLLTKATGSQCQAVQLGPAWTSPSPLVCFIVCQTHYPCDCNTVVYNENTLNCVPASRAFSAVETYTSSIPTGNNPDDAIYLSKISPECNASLGFALYQDCGTSACLHISTTKMDYQSALAECDSRNATLFVANSLQKFSLFWTVSLNYIHDDTFLGLTDSATEGHFVWANGNSLSSDQGAYIWAPGQPDDNGGREDCGEARHGHWPGVFGLNDAPCTSSKRFICEYEP